MLEMGVKKDVFSSVVLRVCKQHPRLPSSV